MKKIILIVLSMFVGSLALADFPVLLCDADIASESFAARAQYLVDMNNHTVYLLVDEMAPQKQRVIAIEDNRVSSGDTVTYTLPWGTKIHLSDQGEDHNNPWSLFSETEGSGACKGQ